MKCSVSFPSGKGYWKYCEMDRNSRTLSVFLGNRTELLPRARCEWASVDFGSVFPFVPLGGLLHSCQCSVQGMFRRSWLTHRLVHL